MNATEVLRVTGVTFRQLDHWCRKGWLGPELQKSMGSGYGRDFTRAQMQQMSYAKALIDFGLDSHRAVELAGELLNTEDEKIGWSFVPKHNAGSRVVIRVQLVHGMPVAKQVTGVLTNGAEEPIAQDAAGLVAHVPGFGGYVPETPLQSVAMVSESPLVTCHHDWIEEDGRLVCVHCSATRFPKR